jgi:diaminopimelate decarboxylase
MDAPLLAEAAQRFGTPLYVTDLDRAAANFAAYRAALPNALIAYAVKANPDPQLLRRLVAEGAGAEVVNATELALARAAGCPPHRIVMNGIGRSDAELVEALEAGVLVNAESLDDLAVILASAAPEARIGLRLNPALDAATHPHLATGASGAKFGIGWADLTDAAARIAAADRRVTAIGAHIGSDIADATTHAELLGRLRSARDAVGAERIDLGGGLRTADQVGEIATDEAIIVEPGRSIVADAGWLLTRVIRTQPRADLTYLVADAGMTELIRPMLYGAEHPVRLLTPGGELRAPRVDLAGPVCEAGDVLAHDIGRWMDTARAGIDALLAIEGTGAYGAAMASNYNGRLRPAQAVIEGGALRLSRRRETLEDLVARDVL